MRVYLAPKDVPAQLRGIDGYSGTKYALESREEVSIPSDAGMWDGGSRTRYLVVELATGKQVDAVNHQASPFNGSRQDRRFALSAGLCVVEHSMYRGKDMGLLFVVHPDNAAKLLPAAVELCELDWQVLDIIGGLKSCARDDERQRRGIKLADYDAAKVGLIARGFLTKIGAITPEGRNARGSSLGRGKYPRSQWERDSWNQTPSEVL